MAKGKVAAAGKMRMQPKVQPTVKSGIGKGMHVKQIAGRLKKVSGRGK